MKTGTTQPLAATDQGSNAHLSAIRPKKDAFAPVPLEAVLVAATNTTIKLQLSTASAVRCAAVCISQVTEHKDGTFSFVGRCVVAPCHALEFTVVPGARTTVALAAKG